MITARLPFPEVERPVRLRDAGRLGPAYRRATAGLQFRRLSATMPRRPARRAVCRLDAYEFGRRYFPHFDWDNPFLREYMGDLQAAVLVDAQLDFKKAIAAPRGIGKTTAALIVVLWACLYGHVRFVAILSGAQKEAINRLDTVQNWVLSNDLLAEDFPELCDPVRAVDGDPRRAKMGGFTWSLEESEFANGVLIMAGGLQGPVRGLNRRSDRPDFVLLDDVEDEDTVKSPKESDALQNRIINEVLGLHEKGARVVFLYLCTLITRDCLSARFTDSGQEPEWRGKRYKALIADPEDAERWSTFMDLCRGQAQPPDEITGTIWHVVSMRSGGRMPLADADLAAELGIAVNAFELYTDEHKAALRYYWLHKGSMDRGAVCLDPSRRPLHDLYHERATKGEHYYLCEIQQTPPEKDDREKHLQAEYLESRKTGSPGGVVPAWAAYVICSVDVGLHRLHWEADAWDRELNTSQLIDQGIQETHVNAAGKYEMADGDEARHRMVEDGIREGLGALNVRFAEGWPAATTGEIVQAAKIVVDCGGAVPGAERREGFAWFRTVIMFCARAGRRWSPVRGERWIESISRRAEGRNWICEQNNNPGQRIDANADEYKLQVVRAYEMPGEKDGQPFPGARLLHADTPREYLKQQTSERYVATVSAGRELGRDLKVGWQAAPGMSRRNHWFDTAWMNYLARDLLRIRSVKKIYGVVGKAFG